MDEMKPFDCFHKTEKDIQVDSVTDGSPLNTSNTTSYDKAVIKQELDTDSTSNTLNGTPSSAPNSNNMTAEVMVKVENGYEKDESNGSYFNSAKKSRKSKI